MNETEQKPRTAVSEDTLAAYEAEHADRNVPPTTSQKSGKLPKSVVAVVAGCLALNLLMMATVAVLLAAKWGQERAGKTATETTANPHEGEIYIEDGALGGMWLKEYTNVEKSTVLTDKITDDGEFKAYNAGSIPAKTGIDVSEYQTVSDWDAVRASGVQFVMIRAGWRGYEEGVFHEDASFRDHIEGALAAGLRVGVYFFSQAVTPGEARQEANFVLDLIADYDVTYPVVFDWEAVEGENARTYGIQNDQLTALAKEFAAVVKANGYTPMLHFYKHLGYLQYDLSQLTDYDYWLAEPGDKPTFYYRYAMWQYKTDGVVPGVEGTVDLNMCFVPYG